MSDVLADLDLDSLRPVPDDAAPRPMPAPAAAAEEEIDYASLRPVVAEEEIDLNSLTPLKDGEEPIDFTSLTPLPDDYRMWEAREKSFNDPEYVMTPEEFAIYHRKRVEEDNEVGRFISSMPGAVAALAGVVGGAVKESVQQAPRNVVDPVGGAVQAVATGAEGIRKAGVGLAQLWTWATNKVEDVQARQRRVDFVRKDLEASGKLAGLDRRDAQALVASELEARQQAGDPAFNEMDREDAQRAYEQYTRNKALDRAYMGIGAYRLGTSQITEDFENPYQVSDPRTGQRVAPQENLSTVASMVADPINMVPLGAGALSKLRVLRRFAHATEGTLGGIERAAAAVSDAGKRLAESGAAKLTEKTGLTMGQQTAIGTSALVAGGLASQSESLAPLGTGIAVVGGILPALRAGGVVVRNVGRAAGGARTIIMESKAGPLGAARLEAARELAASGAVPEQFAKHMRGAAGEGLDSTLMRVADSPENPELLRRAARFADRIGGTGLARVADDAATGALVGGVVAAPFAALAPTSEQAGATVGGGILFGAAGSLAAGKFGRPKAAIDADIARMMADVHASGGDVGVLNVMPYPELAKLAGMQGVLHDKVDFVPLRRRDYRANADVAARRAETTEGLFAEKGNTERARIFIDMGEPAMFDGTVRVTPVEGGKTVEVVSPDGRMDRTFVPAGDKLLVRNGQKVKANDPLVEGWNRQRLTAHEIAHAVLRSDMLDGDHRADLRNMVNQMYGEAGVAARGREYAAKLVDEDIKAGVIEDAPVAMSREEAAALDSGSMTMADVLKARRVAPERREQLIADRMEELNQAEIERGGQPMDWARDEIVAETFADESASLDFSRLRQGRGQPLAPRVAESMLAATSRVLEMFGARFDETTGRLLDRPGQLFEQNPLMRDRVMSQRLTEYVRNYNQFLVGLEDAGSATPRGVELARTTKPEELARSQHVKLRDQGRGVLENDFMEMSPDGRPVLKQQADINLTEKMRQAQVAALGGKKVMPANSREFGPRRTDGGRIVVGGPVLPEKFDFMTHFPQHVRDFARAMESGRGEGMSWNVDYNAIGTGATGRYKVTNLGNVRAIQREVVPFGWTVSKANHLLANVVDLNAFRAAAMKAINKGELDLFNNDMRQLNADLKVYFENHRNGLPGEATIGQAKRDMLNGLLSTGTATMKKANPLYHDLNPRGVIRAFRIDRINDVQPSGRTGFHFDYDKSNNNRMPRRGDRTN